MLLNSSALGVAAPLSAVRLQLFWLSALLSTLPLLWASTTEQPAPRPQWLMPAYV
jgi:hypothetical protein